MNAVSRPRLLPFGRALGTRGALPPPVPGGSGRLFSTIPGLVRHCVSHHSLCQDLVPTFITVCLHVFPSRCTVSASAARSILTCIHVYVHVYICVYILINVYMSHIYIYMCMYIPSKYTNIYIYIYIYILIPSRFGRVSRCPYRCQLLQRMETAFHSL